MASLTLCLVLFVAAVQAGPQRPSTSTSNSGCDIPVAIFEANSPLLMYDQHTNKTGLIYPETSDRIIRIEAGKTVRLACTKGPEDRFPNLIKMKIWDNGRNQRPLVNSLGKETLILKCKGGNKFYQEPDTAVSNGKKKPTDRPVYDIDQFICENPCKASYGEKKPKELCAPGSQLKEVKFLSSDGSRHVVLDYCRSQNNAYTIWSHSIVHPWAPLFNSQGQYWSNFDTTGSVNEKFMFPTQQEALCHSLGLRKECAEIKETLDRGHLVARADMYYPAERSATYDYVNSIPQWSSINRGNWVKIEIAVRQLATTRGNNLDVWTGQVGSLKYRGIELYLNRRASAPNAGKVPIPEYIFKIVYDSTANQGVAIVTIHNPFLTNGANMAALIKCEAVSIPTIKKVASNNVREGYTFCCKIDDFMQKYGIQPPSKLKQATNTTLLKF